MKHLLRRFEAWATVWTYNDFKRAHLKLSLLYIAIIATVIGVFTFIIIHEVNKKLESQALVVETKQILSEDDALSRAVALRPNATVTGTEYTLEGGILTLDAFFDDGEEARVELLTGRSYLDVDKADTFWGSFFDELDKTIILFALMMLVIASTVATFVAKTTLVPIAKKIKEQDRFIADTSHELRNPLAAVSASLDALIRVPAKSRRELELTLQGMKEEHQRLIQLSENLLELTRTGEKGNTTISNITISTPVQKIIKQLHHLTTEKKILIVTSVADTPLIIGFLDFESLAFNLIHNALKFSGEGSVVRVFWTNDKKLIITDYGSGITADDLPHIFERFYKADKARSFEKETGSGLGLSIVQAIVRKYQASIAVESIFGKGTTVTVSF